MDSLVRIVSFQWVMLDFRLEIFSMRFLGAKGRGDERLRPRLREAQDCSSGKFSHVSDFLQAVVGVLARLSVRPVRLERAAF